MNGNGYLVRSITPKKNHAKGQGHYILDVVTEMQKS